VALKADCQPGKPVRVVVEEITPAPRLKTTLDFHVSGWKLILSTHREQEIQRHRRPKRRQGPASRTYAGAPVNASLSADQKIGLYRLMVRIRRFEERSLGPTRPRRSAASSTFTSARRRSRSAAAP
jgi:hypothetical protein